MTICTPANTVWATNKELELYMHLQGYDLIGITKAWWDGSHDWNAAIAVYRLFGIDRRG